LSSKLIEIQDTKKLSSSKIKIYDKWEKNRDRSFFNMLEPNPDNRVIDIGCGNGAFSYLVKDKIRCEKIWGIDLNEEGLDEARKRGVIVTKSDLNCSFPLDADSFDVIVSNQVIEHLFYPIKFMREIHRVLKPGGYAIISTENLASWDNVGALSFGNTPFSLDCEKHAGSKEEYSYFSHFGVFAWNGLIALSRVLSFNVEKAVGNGHILGRVGEILDKKHSRFITLKLRKVFINKS
jgi:ubiquinone/menaquinone biosynthesis C-methylase UbiE